VSGQRRKLRPNKAYRVSRQEEFLIAAPTERHNRIVEMTTPTSSASFGGWGRWVGAGLSQGEPALILQRATLFM